MSAAAAKGKAPIDVSALSPEEQEFYKKYGKLPLPKKDLLGKRLNGDRKYFDSGDYALSQAGKSSPKDVGSQHPSPERIPHSNPATKETAVPAGKESSLVHEANGAVDGAPHSNKRKETPSDGSSDAKRVRTGPAAAAAAAANASGGSSAVPDKDKIAELIAAKRREIAEKMAAMTRNLPTARVAPPEPAAPPPAKELSQDDIKRRMDEIQARMKNTLASGNIPAAIADPAKRGLKMDVHPLFDKSGAVDVDSIKSMFAKPNFSTAKANQRVTPAANKEAAAVAARLALAAIEKKKEEENKANGITPDEPPVKKTLELVEPSPDLFDPAKNPYFDPKIAKSMPKQRVAGKAFRFIQPNKFVNMANKLRQDAMLEKLKADIAANAKKSGMAVELDLVSDLCVRREPPPATEWWDATFLGQDTPYEQFTFEAPHLDNILTDLIQHPVPIQPPADLGPPPPKPLMLTKKETKKLRRQRRLEAQKEKREKISIGLIPPDQPKVKISNLMRVLGTEAVQDPTKIEAAVRQQMRARQLKHDKYIAEHKLTKEQRQERNRLKLIENTHVIVEACVFKVNELKGKNKFKVNVNASQLFLSGAILLHPGSNLVIVEGGNRGIKQYKKLMLRRIDWIDGAGEDPDEDEEGAGKVVAEDNGKPNECVMIWEGKIKRRLFNGFSEIDCPTERSIKTVLEKAGAIHYWDAAKHYAPESL
ncbi:UNVERIFIED_CONTAM: hypothetical protein HDU68_008629 [Siphonaria sp. JEL0065]|nr:hypothetical protein HDU68_008629 [Siphonaria sp. JEL0065]